MEEDLKTWKQSKVLSTSIQDDKCRQEVDAAKKRAAAQNVDYPTFAAMVSAAHLQPIDRKSMVAPRFEPSRSVPAWSFGCSGDLLRGSDQEQRSEKPVTKDEVLQSLASVRGVRVGEVSRQKQAPLAGGSKRMTMDSFQRTWVSLAREPLVKRVEFLAGTSFPEVFRVEMPVGVVVSIVEALHDAVVLREGSECEVSGAAVEVLSSMAKCSRFQISVKLMELKCGSLLGRLFDELESFATGNEDLVLRIRELKPLYLSKINK